MGVVEEMTVEAKMIVWYEKLDFDKMIGVENLGQ
jgi:hypothetical protein